MEDTGRNATSMNPPNVEATEKKCATRFITINFDRTHLAQLPEKRKNLLLLLEDELNNRELTVPSTYEVRLPLSTIIQNEGWRKFQLSDLFETPANIDEPKSLAISERGEKKCLSSDQLVTVHEEAQLSVRSRKYPDRFHIWKLNGILQEGSLNTQTVFQKILSSSLEHLIITIPENIFDHSDHETNYSAQKGVKIIYRGILALLSSLIGFIEEVPQHDHSEVSAMVNNQRIEFIKESIAADSSLDTSVFRTCLYDDEITKAVKADLQRIRDDHGILWSVHNLQRLSKLSHQKFAKTHPEAGRGNSQLLFDLVHEDLQNQKFEILKESFRADISLNEICPGYGVLLANQLSAERIVTAEENRLAGILSLKVKAFHDQISQQHPILSQIEGWLGPRINRQTRGFVKENEARKHDDIVRKLLEMDLQLESYIANKSLKYEKEEGELYRATLSSKKVPSYCTDFAYHIWRPKNWIPEKSRDDQTFFYPVKYRVSKVCTDHHFWRWTLMAHRIVYILNDCMHSILVDNMLNGHLGLRAMSLASLSYHPRWSMDERTGIVSIDRNYGRSTYRANLEATISRYSDLRFDFERTPDEGLLGKGITRPFHIMYHLLLCAAGVLVIGVVQPLLTFINITISIFIAMTAPIWAVFYSIFMLLLSCIIWDIDYPYQGHLFCWTQNFLWFPIPFQVFHILYWGLGQVIFKLVQCVLYDFPMFILKGLHAYVRYGARRVWDNIMMSILRTRMKVPGVDSFWAKRIKGPGLSNNYYFQVEPEVAMNALQATLDKEDLDYYVVKETKEINRPLRELIDFFKDLLQPLSIDASMLPETHKLRLDEYVHLKALNEAARIRYKDLARGAINSNLSHSLNRIKLTEENLTSTMARSQVIVTNFYKESIATYISADDLMKYWINKDLFEDDFEGLTLHYYSKTFHKDFLTPLQRRDDDLIIKVIQPSFSDIVTYFPCSNVASLEGTYSSSFTISEPLQKNPILPPDL